MFYSDFILCFRKDVSVEEFKSDFSLLCFFAESQIFFVPMMPFLKIRDVSGQARFLVSANSLNELKAKGIKASLFLLNYF